MAEYAKIFRYFNTQGADSPVNLFGFRKYFTEPGDNSTLLKQRASTPSEWRDSVVPESQC